VLKRHVEAHDETLNHLADAVAIFDSAKRLSFHNTAFAELWGLEPPGWRSGPATPRCWIACASAGGCRRRWTTASGAPRAGFYETLDAPPDELWSLPDSRTLRVVRQPHPLGGPAAAVRRHHGRGAAQGAVQQPDQGAAGHAGQAQRRGGGVRLDGRLRLHNEAFERFWNLPARGLATR
jgi:PAS domain-containing protein